MFRLLSFVLKFYPVVMIVIEIVEAFTKGRPGEEKKALVMRVVTELAKRFGVTLSNAHVALISQIIDAIVAVLNTLGLFTHSEKDEEEEEEVVEEIELVREPVRTETDIRLDELETIFAR